MDKINQHLTWFTVRETLKRKENKMLAPEVISALIEVRRNEILKEAEIHRLLEKARSARPKLQNRLLAGIGGLLISVGKRLQEQYTPVVHRSGGSLTALTPWGVSDTRLRPPPHLQVGQAGGCFNRLGQDRDCPY